jgi:hypothetical protein
MTWQTMKRLLWSAAGGAVTWWIVLSVVLGWMPPWSAAKQAGEQAEAAVLHALAPICVARFEQDGDRAHKLEALKHASSWMRGSFVMEQGWATMPGAAKPGAGVAAECAIRILATSSS